MVERRCAITITVRLLHQVGQRPLHQHFGLGVQVRRGFVQDQDRRILEQRARDRQPLPLPAAELDARARRSRCRSPPAAA